MADNFTTGLPLKPTVDTLIGNKDGETVIVLRENITNGASPSDIAAVADRATALEAQAVAQAAVKVTGGGLVTGGGDLSAGRTITVTAATAAETNARGRSDVAVTPAALAGASVDGLVRVKTADSYTSHVAYGTALDAGTDIPVDDLLDGLKFSVRSTGSGVALSIQVYEQLNAGRGNVRPGADANDTLIFTLTPTLASLGVTPGGAVANVVVPLGGYVRVRAGYSYGVIVSVLNSSSVAVTTGMGTLTGTFAEARRQTWYTDDGVTWSAGGGQSVAFSATRRATFVATDPDFIKERADRAAADAALSTGKADKATLLNAAGLAGGGGDLSASRTITVTPATAAEVNARSRSDAAVTPAALAGASVDSLARTKTVDSYSTRVGYGTALDAGTDIPVDDLLDGLKFAVRSTGTGASLSIKVYEQLNAGRGNVRPGADANDTLIFTLTPTLASLGVTPGGAVANVVVPLGGYVRVRAGYSYGVIFSVLNSSSVAVTTGAGVLTGTFTEARRQTWYTDDGVTWSSASGQSIAFSTTRRATHVATDPEFVKEKADRTAADVAQQAAITSNTSRIAALEPSVSTIAAQIVTKALTIGRPADAALDAGTAGVNGNVYVFGQQATHSGVIMRIRAWGSTGGPRTMQVKLWMRSGDDWTQRGTDVPISIAAGNNAIDVNIPINAGEWPGGFLPTNSVTYLNGAPGDSGGYYSTTGGANVSSFTDSSSTTTVQLRLAFDIEWQELAAADPPATSTAAPDVSVRDHVPAMAASAAGLTVTIDSSVSRLRRQSGDIVVGGAVTLDATTTGSVVDEARTLQARGSALSIAYTELPNLGKLANANVSSVVVKDASTNAVLVLNADYILNAEHGALSLVATSGSDRPVKVSYNYARRRYDVIYLDAVTLALGVVKGTERIRDAAEFVPAAGASSRIPLYNVRVVGSAVELIPLWDIDVLYRRGLDAQVADDRARARRALRATRRRLTAGSALSIIGYADSITAIQYSAPSNTVPGGTLRDRGTGSFLNSGAIGSDVISGVPLYDFSDGAGQVHTKIGWNWELKAALEAAYGSTITYVNFGIGGTTSATGFSNTTSANGRETGRLAALTASGANLCVLAFGMNEIGDANTEANTVAIIQAAQAVGMEVIVVTCPRPNAYRGGTYTYAGWLLTNRALRRAAEYCGAAILDTTMLAADEHRGALGLSANDMAASNLTNHPGLKELSLYGRALAALLLDE